MEINSVLDALKKAGDLLKDRNIYYAIVLGFLGYWIWSKDQIIIEMKAENKVALGAVEKEKEVIQAKLDSKDCAQEVRAYKELLDGLNSTTANKAEDQLKALDIERKRTQELEKTYQLLNNK